MEAALYCTYFDCFIEIASPMPHIHWHKPLAHATTLTSLFSSLSKPLQQSETLHHETPPLRNSPSQGDEVKDQEHVWLSVSGETPCNRAFKDDEWLKGLSHTIPNRPVSMATEYLTPSTAIPIRPSFFTQKVTPPPSRIVEVEDGSGRETRLSPSLGVAPPTHSEPRKPEIAPLAECEPFLAVRLRTPRRMDATAPSDKGRVMLSSVCVCVCQCCLARLLTYGLFACLLPCFPAPSLCVISVVAVFFTLFAY